MIWRDWFYVDPYPQGDLSCAQIPLIKGMQVGNGTSYFPTFDHQKGVHLSMFWNVEGVTFVIMKTE